MQQDKVGNYKLLLWGVFILALMARVAHVFLIQQNSPFFDILPGDLGAYDRWARKILAEGWLGREIFYQDPLYPYFLALIYKIFGHSLLAVYLLQSLLGALTSLVVLLIGERSLGWKAGLIGGLLFACYGPAIYFDGLLLKVSLATFLLSLAVLLWFRALATRRTLDWILSGTVLGLACLTRGNMLLLFPALLVLPCFDKSLSREKCLKSGGLMILGGLLVFAPVALRNYVVGGELVITTSQAGANFYLGNSPQAKGVYWAPSFVRADPVYEQHDFRVEAEKRLGRELSAGEVSRYWFSQGLGFIADSPGQFLVLTARKLALVLNYYEIADNHNFYFHRRYSPVLQALPVGFGLIGPLFLFGLIWLLIERPRFGIALGVTTLIYLLSVVLFYVFSRYRMPIIPLLCLVSGYGVEKIYRTVREGSLGTMTSNLLLLIFLVLFCHWRFQPEFDFSHSFTDEGLAYEMKGDYQRSLASYQEGVRLDPRSLRGLERLGLLQVKLGQYGQALGTYQQILRIYPQNQAARAYLGWWAGRAGTDAPDRENSPAR